MERLFLRPAEAAEVLGLGRTTLYALIEAGKIPVVRVGRSIRIPVAELQKWADEQGRSAPGGELPAGGGADL